MPKIVAQVVDAYVLRPGGSDQPGRAAGGGWEVLQMRRTAGEPVGRTWQTVHGFIEPGVSEETSLAVRELYQLDHVNVFYMAYNDTVNLCACFACLVDAAAEPTLNHEHDAHRWLALPEGVERFLWPGERDALRQIVSEVLADSPAKPVLRIEIPDRRD